MFEALAAEPDARPPVVTLMRCGGVRCAYEPLERSRPAEPRRQVAGKKAGVPYGLVLLVGSIGLPFYFVAFSSAPSRMKWVVGALACLSLVLVFWFPQLVVLRTLVQLAVCLVVIVYLKVHPYGV